jgi:VanZ family protein
MISIPYRDKFIHLGVYFIASVLMMYGLGGPFGRSFGRGVVYTLVFCIMWGAMLEYLQKTISTGRHFEVNDIIANIIGAFMGVFVFSILFKKRYYGS